MLWMVGWLVTHLLVSGCRNNLQFWNYWILGFCSNSGYDSLCKGRFSWVLWQIIDIWPRHYTQSIEHDETIPNHTHRLCTTSTGQDNNIKNVLSTFCGITFFDEGGESKEKKTWRGCRFCNLKQGVTLNYVVKIQISTQICIWLESGKRSLLKSTLLLIQWERWQTLVLKM